MDYKDKFDDAVKNTVYGLLESATKEFLKEFSCKYKLTYQEIKIFCDIFKDLSSWDSKFISKLKVNLECAQKQNIQNPKKEKELAVDTVKQYYEKLKLTEKEYKLKPSSEVSIKNLKIVSKEATSNIFGSCPVYSEKTVCCGLKTLDAVQNCPFNCAYCTIQTFYNDDFIFVSNLKEKLNEIKLQKDKFYHIGTGQSSDALVWGNTLNILDDLISFANANQNVLLELKTKSSNTKYFEALKEIPKNIVCSWSVNPQSVISNEELGTASLKDRLEAAKKLINLKIKVAFHFHPIIYFKNWENEYKEIVDYIKHNFLPQDISFISFGSLTFIKPVIKQIREKKIDTKILQMPTGLDPNGKITYTKELKIKLYKTLYSYFSQEFKDNVYFYLCMETKDIWNEVLGYTYQANEDFLNDFGKKTLGIY